MGLIRVVAHEGGIVVEVLDSVKNAAKWAGEQLNVPWQIILGQWAYEQPDGLANPAKYNYNIAGITSSGIPGQWRAYKSVQDFANDYVTLIKSGYSNAIGSQTATEYASALKNGKWGSYFGGSSIESYASGIDARISQFGETVTTAASTGTSKSWGSLKDSPYLADRVKYWYMFLTGQSTDSPTLLKSWNDTGEAYNPETDTSSDLLHQILGPDVDIGYFFIRVAEVIIGTVLVVLGSWQLTTEMRQTPDKKEVMD